MNSVHNISLQFKDLKAIETASLILKRGFPVVEIRLFGSKAKGRDDKESDIDLLVLTSKEISWRERNAMTDALYETQLKWDVVISLLVVSAEQWKSGLISALPIHDTIEEEGIAA